MASSNMDEKPLYWRIPDKQIMKQYPQMGIRESQIWSYFLTYVPWDDILYIDYAFRVGKPYVSASHYEPSIQRMIEAVTKLRIDAVVHRVSEIWLMEVKEIANLVALGQLLTYEHYYIKEVKPMKPVRLGVVAEDYKLNIEEVAKRYQITIFLAKPYRLEIIS